MCLFKHTTKPSDKLLTGTQEEPGRSSREYERSLVDRFSCGFFAVFCGFLCFVQISAKRIFRYNFQREFHMKYFQNSISYKNQKNLMFFCGFFAFFYTSAQGLGNKPSLVLHGTSRYFTGTSWYFTVLHWYFMVLHGTSQYFTGTSLVLQTKKLQKNAKKRKKTVKKHIKTYKKSLKISICKFS